MVAIDRSSEIQRQFYQRAGPAKSRGQVHHGQLTRSPIFLSNFLSTLGSSISCLRSSPFPSPFDRSARLFPSLLFELWLLRDFFDLFACSDVSRARKHGESLIRRFFGDTKVELAGQIVLCFLRLEGARFRSLRGSEVSCNHVERFSRLFYVPMFVYRVLIFGWGYYYYYPNLFRVVISNFVTFQEWKFFRSVFTFLRIRCSLFSN